MILEQIFGNYGEAGYTYRQLEKDSGKPGAVPQLICKDLKLHHRE